MPDATINGAQSAQTATKPKKVVRRGINNTTTGTARLKFSENDANPSNGLFLAHIENVEITEATIGEDKTGIPSFAGLTIPFLNIYFASNDADVNRRKYVRLRFSPVESSVETIPGGKGAWKVDRVLNWLKHILDVFVLKGREMTEEEIVALSLSYEDFDEQGEYINVDGETVVAAWKTLFENFVNILVRGKDDAPYYKSNDGKFITVWIKLLRYIKAGKKGWQEVDGGNLSFPQFVGEGAIELYKQNVPPVLRVDVTRENIRPMKLEKPKTPNMPAGLPGGVSVDAGMGLGGGLGSDGFMPGAGIGIEDMPEF